MGFPDASVSKESTCNAEDVGSVPGSGTSPGEGNGPSLQYSRLGNPMDRGAWWAAVHGGVNTLYFLQFYTFLSYLEITILICALYIMSLGHWIWHSSMSNFPNFCLSVVDFILTKRETSNLKLNSVCGYCLGIISTFLTLIAWSLFPKCPDKILWSLLLSLFLLYFQSCFRAIVFS